MEEATLIGSVEGARNEHMELEGNDVGQFNQHVVYNWSNSTLVMSSPSGTTHMPGGGSMYMACRSLAYGSTKREYQYHYQFHGASTNTQSCRRKLDLSSPFYSNQRIYAVFLTIPIGRGDGVPGWLRDH